MREPYFIQIGLDFGTSYSKCIYRDIMTDQAWVYNNPNTEIRNSFLIPSTLLYSDKNLGQVNSSETHYPPNGLYHLKHALVKCALQLWDDPVLNQYYQAIENENHITLECFIENSVVYFLARTLGDIKNEIKRRFQDFGLHPKDYMAVNMAVPVADAERPEINNLYHRMLYEGWLLSDELAGVVKISLEDLESLRNKYQDHNNEYLEQSCFIYPEVSANVQGFVRSHVSSPGIYLFSDIGGWTVDQSIFIFFRDDQGEQLTYLTGRILPLGSSYIEKKAAEICGQNDCRLLELLRKEKETNRNNPALENSRTWIKNKLIQETESTLAHARNRLYRREQINELNLIFGGGGVCRNPYKIAVKQPFSGQLFRNPIRPNIIGLPNPNELEGILSPTWINRLYVAYGLSFAKVQLANFRYPKDVPIPEPEQIWLPTIYSPDAPTMDDV